MNEFNVVQGMIRAGAVALLVATGPALAQQVAFSPTPPLASPAPAKLMLTLSRDHTLFTKAYNEYSDIDRNGAIETTYSHTIDYSGYFDSTKCYSYTTGVNRFTPVRVTSDKYCGGSGEWSGNFLNWLSMSKVDLLRRVLYGGKRVDDQSNRVVLERETLPTNTHSWVKYYNGADLARLTPFTAATVMPTSVSSTPRALREGKLNLALGSLGDLTGVAIGDIVEVSSAGNPNLRATGHLEYIDATNLRLAILDVSISAAAKAAGYPVISDWRIRVLNKDGVSFCSTTPPGTPAAAMSHQTNSPPVLRVARGNYSLWTANENVQCRWREESADLMSSWAPMLRDYEAGTLAPIQGNSNGNVYAISEIAASAENPERAIVALGRGLGAGEYAVRVQVCVAGLIGAENCKQYPSGALKPVGLLHSYGESDLMHFGLMSGSYDRNVSGGVLRRNVQSFRPEVDATNGTWANVQGIVHTIDRLKFFGYRYDQPFAGNRVDDVCVPNHDMIVPSGGADPNATGQRVVATWEGTCASWGAPIGEMYLETLRYFAGKSRTGAFNAATRTNDNTMSLPSAAWVDSMNAANSCSTLATLVISGGDPSYDHDQWAGFADLNAASGVRALTNQIGAAEGVNGRTWIAAAVGALNNEMCSAKVVGDLADVLGVCPASPRESGSYLIAGAAWHARTNPVRDDIASPTGDTKAFRVKTMVMQLGQPTPVFKVDVGGSAVSIVPMALNLAEVPAAARPLKSMPLSGLHVIRQTPTSGKIFVAYEDSLHGSDNDADNWGTIEWAVVAGRLRITTTAAFRSQHLNSGVGYLVSGTTRDGPHFHSGAQGRAETSAFKWVDPAPPPIVSGPHPFLNATGGCEACVGADGPTTAEYMPSASGSHPVLRSPLWFAAKWGGFEDQNGNGVPDLQSEWDRTDRFGAAVSDGDPDNYFSFENPVGLARAMQAQLSMLAASVQATPGIGAASSGMLNDETFYYQLGYSPQNWTGQIKALKVSASGALAAIPTWDTNQTFGTVGENDRVVLTASDDASNLDVGLAFRWANLTTTQRAALNRNGSNVVDGLGAQRVEFVRGSNANEGAGTSDFRIRSDSRLGASIYSSLAYVGKPSAGYVEDDYFAFYTTNKDRAPMLYLGSSDGMLHGIDAATGAPRLSFVPSALYPKLSKLTERAYSHDWMVDSQIKVEDAKVNGAWRTMLVATLGRGGHGVFALDVTDPSQFTEAGASSVVAWEFTDRQDPDVGNVLSEPQIVKLANGRWAAAFVSGYNNSAADGRASATGGGFLFLVYLDRTAANGKTFTLGVDYEKIAVSPGTVASPAGLSGPFAVDQDFNGTTDNFVVGDLQGRVWRVAASDPSPTNWAPAHGTTPFFQARDSLGVVQPITGGFDVMLHPDGGLFVFFGTGKMLEAADATNRQVQSFYGVWEFEQTPVTGRAQLQQQQMLYAFDDVGGRFRTSTKNYVDYWSAPYEKGWYIDLLMPGTPAGGERFTQTPTVRGDRIIFNTIVPGGGSVCAPGSSWLNELTTWHGKRLYVAPFDMNGDRKIDWSDWIEAQPGVWGNISGREWGNGTTSPPTIIRTQTCQDGVCEHKIANGSSGTAVSIVESTDIGPARLSWREILGI